MAFTSRNTVRTRRLCLTALLVAAVMVTDPLGASAEQWWRWWRPKKATVSLGDLASKPLLQEADMELDGGFLIPFDSAGGTDSYDAGIAVAYNPTNGHLFVGGGAGGAAQKVMEVSIPALVNTSNTALMNTGTVIQSLTDVTEGTKGELASDPAYFKWGGLLVYGGRLCFSAFHYYDSDNGTRVSHGCHSLTLSASSFEGWDTFWDNVKTGHLSGPMAELQDYAQLVLGGTVLAGGAPASIISRLSWGAAAIPIDPALISGRTPNTHTAIPLLDYTQANPLEVVSEERYINNQFHETWTQATEMNAMVAPKGTRTLLVIGRHGYGDRCYGNGTGTEALHGTPNEADPNHEWCYDPRGIGSQGNHAYEYRYQVWAYDLLRLAEVKAGTRQPYDVQPYDIWTLTLPVALSANANVIVGASGYDATNNRLFLPQRAADPMGCPGSCMGHSVMWRFTFTP